MFFFSAVQSKANDSNKLTGPQFQSITDFSPFSILGFVFFQNKVMEAVKRTEVPCAMLVFGVE